MKVAGTVLIVTGAGSPGLMDRLYRLAPRLAMGFIARQMKTLLAGQA